MRLRLSILIKLIFISISSKTYSDTLLTFPNKNAANEIISTLYTGKKSIKMLIYRLENKEIIDAIIDIQKHGVKVEIVISNAEKGKSFTYDQFYKKTFEKLSKNQKVYNKLKELGVKIIYSNQDDFFSYHPKLVIIDDHTAILGTSNFNDNGFVNARNFMIITHDKSLIKELDTIFIGDFTKNYVNYKEKQNTSIALSPGNYLKQIYKIIDSAQKEIDIYQTMMGHIEICNKIAKKADSGLKINILTSKRNIHNSKLKEVQYCESKLRHLANVEWKYLNDPYYIHAKVIIADYSSQKPTCFVGSSLFWSEGFDKNRELGILTHNNKIIQQIHQTFIKDFDLGVYNYKGIINLD